MRDLYPYVGFLFLVVVSILLMVKGIGMAWVEYAFSRKASSWNLVPIILGLVPMYYTCSNAPFKVIAY